MTATTAAGRQAPLRPTPGLSGLSVPLILSCVIPLVVALAVGGWVRLLAAIMAVAGGAGLVADGFLGTAADPAPDEPWCEGRADGLERAS